MKRSELAVVFGITFLFVMGVASVAPAMPHLRSALELSPLKVTVLMAAFALPGVFLAPLFGAILDRFGRVRVLIPALLVYGLAGCLVFFAADFWSLLALRLVQGAGNAPLGTIAITLIGDRSAEGERAARLGTNAAMLSLGTAIWPALGGALGAVDWRYPFILAGLALPLALAAGLVFKDEGLGSSGAPGERGRYAAQAWAGVKDRRTVGLYAAALGSFFLLYGPFLTFLPLHLASRFALSPAGIGMIVSFMSVPTILTALATGALQKRWTSRSLIAAAFALYAAALALLPLAPSPAFSLVPAALFGIAQALAIPNILILLSRQAAPAQRAMIISVYSMFMHLGQTLSPLAVGLSIAAFGGGLVFAGGAVAALALFALVPVLAPVPAAAAPAPAAAPSPEPRKEA